MAWQQITLHIEAESVRRTEALLKLAGAEAVAISDDGDDPVLEPQPGTTPMWPRIRMTALFDARLDLAGLPLLLGSQANARAMEVSAVTERDWIGAWRQSISPIVIDDRLEIIPLEDMDSPAAAPRVVLSMGLAFGTGRHPTTRLCLEWLACEPWSADTILDFGCGSGVLALAALRLGARFAYATDNDDQALIAVRENARLNDMEERIRIAAPDALPKFTADLVLANILAGTLCGFAASFAARQHSGGRIVLSGILDAQANDVITAFTPFYEDFRTVSSDGWCRISASRRSR